MNTRQIAKSVHRRGRSEGSIIKTVRYGKIRAQYTLPNGQRISKTFGNTKDCKEWFYQMHREVEKGLIGFTSKETLQSYLENWLTRHAKLKEKTRQDYRKHIQKYVTPSLGRIKLSSLKRQNIEHFYLALLKKTTPIMVTHIHRTLHSALEDAVEQGILQVNPAHYADHVIPEEDRNLFSNCSRGEMRFLNDDEARTLLIAARSSPLEALYHLALKTGARQGELLGLKWSDLDWKTARITIQRQYQSIPNGHGVGLFTTPKSNSGRRTVQLGQEVLITLKNHQLKQAIARSLAGGRWKDHDLIFPSSIGTPKNASNLMKDFSDVLKRAGVKHIRFHDLRHTAATLMLNHGIPAIVVAGILGHSNSNVTLSIYGHVMTDQQLPAAKLMDSLITPIEFDPDLIRTDVEISNPLDKRYAPVTHHS